MTLETRDQNLLKTYCKMTFSMKFSLKFGISLLIVKSKSLMNIGCDNRKSELKVEQNFRRKFAPKIKAQGAEMALHFPRTESHNTVLNF